MAQLESPTLTYAAGDPKTAPPLPRWLVRLSAIGLAVIIAYLGYTRVYWVREQAEDFEFFFRAGSELLVHGNLDAGVDREPDGTPVARGTIEWYPPFVSRLMTIPAALTCPDFGFTRPADSENSSRAWPQTPFRWADALWMAVNLAAFVATLRLVSRNLLDLPVADWPAWCIVPIAATALFIHWEFRMNQIDMLTLLLMVGSFVCWQRGRPGVAGFWLGLAVLLKITPALLIVWFVLKRQWRTTTVALATIILAGPVADFAVFGPAYARDIYRGWLRNVGESSQRNLVIAQREMDWRNQGLGAVLARTLSETNVATNFQNDPRAARFNEPPRFANIAELDLATVGLIATGIVFATLAALAWIARRPAAALTPWQLRMEWALFMLAMLWIMPVMRRYHLIWTLPAVMLVLARAYALHWRTPWARFATGGVIGLATTQLALLARPIWGYNLLEIYGVFLLGVAALAFPIVIFLIRDRADVRAAAEALPTTDKATAPAAPAGDVAVAHG